MATRAEPPAVASPHDRRAAAYATSRVPRAGPQQTAGDVVRSLRGAAFESAGEIAVCEDGRFLGLVPIERLLAAAPGLAVETLLEPAPVVGPEDDRELAAARSARAGGQSVAVVGADGLFQGVIPARRLLEVLAEEHAEDLARLGGYLAGTSRARGATQESVRRRLWHRLPWLVLGLAGAMATAGLVASFEDQLRAVVLLAFFVPAVVYMADAVGTQTETVVIRGMSAGIPVREVVRRELATGVVVGALLAAAFLPFAFLVWGDVAVAATVAVALLVSASVATIVAMALPAALARLGHDPAFGSGPLATVIQDLLSIAVYFAVAHALVG